MTDPQAGSEGEQPPPSEVTPRRHRRRRVAVIGLGVAVGLAVIVVVLWNRDSVEPVSMDAARERAALDSGPAAPAAPLVPEEGVYQYRGTGTERLDKPPKTQSQGPEIPGTVTHLDDGCWRLRVDYSTNHWQSWDYCSTGTGLTEQGGEFFQRLELGPVTVDTSSSTTCNPPVDAIRRTQTSGDSWTHACTGTSTSTEGEVTSEGPYTFVGEERIEVGGRPVATLHYRRVRTLGGGQTGTEDVDIWFEATTGLPVRNSRDITVQSGTLLGGVTYTEQGTFTLVSLTPTR